jgi:hypothetical protein
MEIDDLDQVVEDLRKLGIEACHEFVYGPHGCVEGLDVGDDFFPLWELKLAANAEAFSRLDFAAIKSQRSRDWSMEYPRQSVRTAG